MALELAQQLYVCIRSQLDDTNLLMSGRGKNLKFLRTAIIRKHITLKQLSVSTNK